ncbi:MAG: phospho-N-acetylmuramoyl-pentapeptide-transferase [Clostridiales bacterium]|nr:phospho-N-acetylmuramoyl-pentapeptide-transferase [Clostridiales bacterium]
MNLLNLQGNITLSILIPLAVSFAVTALVTNALIPYLKRIGNLQPIYDEAPDEHKRKQGTPTMGGLAILCGIAAGTAASIFTGGSAGVKLVILCITLLFGAIGFLDDFTKITKRRNLGLRARQKLLLQILIGLLFAVWFVFGSGGSTWIVVPFAWQAVNIGYWMIPYIVFIVVAMANAVNLTDGLDGLASGVSAIISLFFPVLISIVFALTLAKNGELLIDRISMDFSGALFFAAMAGSCLGFLLFNRYPARIFMGDTGSLALGGGFAAAAITCHAELFLPIMGLIFVLEALSVIIQVGSYKLRHGKRVFKMAPLHHHFELSGWPEKKVVLVFTTVTLALCAASVVVCVWMTFGGNSTV